MQEQELFQQYELKGWQISPRFYKIIGASLLFNLVAFALMAQANFLTGKTCDSPFASGFCSVIDALYIGSSVSGYDYVDKKYDPTEISDSDEIIMIPLDNEYPPLTYPAGYFALANPDQQPTVTDVFNDPNIPTTGIPGITNVNPAITDPTQDLTKIKPTLPKANDNAITGDLPSSPFGSVNPTITRKGNKNKPNLTKNPTLEDVNGKTKAENKDTPNQDKSEPVKIGEINRKPFEDTGDIINEKRSKNEIDLSKNFSIILDGTIKADGTFDQDKTKFVKATGDEEMVNAAKLALEAVGNSGFLGLLKANGIDRVNITLVQDDTQIYAIVVSDQKTPERAASTASGLGTLLSGAIIADKSNLKKLDESSRVLVENSKVTSDKNNFILKFTLPKQEAQALIIKTLDARAEKKNKLNSSSELNKNTSTEAGK